MAMARQSRQRHTTTRWLPVFILLLLCTILLQLLLARLRRSSFSSSSLPSDASAGATSTSTTANTKNSFRWRKSNRDIPPPVLLGNDNTHHNNDDDSIHAPTRRKYPWKRRADDTDSENKDDDLGDLDNLNDRHGMDKNLLLSNGFMPELDSWGDAANEEDDPTMETSSAPPTSSLMSISVEQQSRGLGIPRRLQQEQPQRLLNVAQTICNSVTPQTLGPGYNGSFASNSPDGVYPSTNRSCTWTILAAANTTSPGGDPNPAGSTLGTGTRTAATSPYIVALNFSTPIQLVCGLDYLTLYDGPDVSWPVIATLCGNNWMDTMATPYSSGPIIYSSGPVMTAVFSSQANSPGSFGFTATWYSVLPCEVCLSSGRGTCNANTCVCSSKTSGVVCEQDTAGFKDFLPRSQHAMAYDLDKDVVYISGGTNAQNVYLSVLDVLTYSFASDKWNKITAASTGQKIPFARYGHYSFLYNGELYIYGGVSVIGGMADVWKFNGKQWLPQTPYNQELLPVGRAGAACTLITTNNSTQLVSFGGIDANNNTARDLFMYDLNTSMWKQSAHKNSVGLSSASAVFHQATESIYFFGGMVNQTIRNTVVFQYSIQQDLWYELAPRIDPLTATAVTPLGGQEPPYPLNSTIGDGTDSGDESSGELQSSNITTYLPPVMYDPLSGVWAPAGLMGDDTVVMYGGMRPFGPGVNIRDQSCYVRTMSFYDLSCQKWTSFEATDLGGVLHNRVNHTMVIRPPGAAGGSKTAYTAYVFGGFDGMQHADMLNITLSIPTPVPTAGEVNSCRALRWCAYYDDCQYCNANYCSYVGGLCLFDTDKAKTPLNPTSPPYLLGTSADIPKNGTLQDLVRQRPNLKTQTITPDQCPIRLLLQLGTTFSNSIQSGQEMTFNIYIDSPNLDIQYEIRTNPVQTLNFKTLNVWEGFMNMYWRADHGLTDNTWNGYSWTSAPTPPDAVDNNGTDVAVISPTGVLNVSELENRWQRYAGLDNSPTSSALTAATTSYIYFPADDPRRFSGYYVFSLTNNHSSAMSFTLTVSLLDRPAPTGPNTGAKFNLATLGYFMIGFMLCVLLLIVLGRKIRQFLERRDLEMRAAAEARMLEEEEAEAEEEERRRLAMALRGENGGDMKDWKPMYKIVLGVQAKRQQDALEDEKGWSSARNLSTTSLLLPRPAGRGARKASTTASAMTGNDVQRDLLPLSHSDSAVPKEGSDSRPKSDFIRDLGSSPQVSSVGDASLRSGSASGVSMDAAQEEEDLKRSDKKGFGHGSTISSRKISILLDRHPSRTSQGLHHPVHGSQEDLRTGSGSGVQRGWSLKSLGRSASLKRIRDHSKVNPEEIEGLTSQTLGNVTLDLEQNQQQQQQQQQQGYDSEQEAIELDVLSRQRSGCGPDIVHSYPESSHWEVGQQFRLQQRKRNPIRVQPISIEPLPFHGGLVARTRRNFKRYQRALARSAASSQGQAQYEYEEERRRHSLRRANLSRSSAGSLRTAHGAASRMASLTRRATSSTSGVRDDYQEAVVDIPVSEDEDAVDLGAATSPGPDHIGAAGTLGQRQEGRELPRRKPIRMRGRQEFEPGPLLAMNVLIVFPGDAGTRPVRRLSEEDGQGDEEDPGESSRKMTMPSVTATTGLDAISEDQRLPPMAIGTVFVPDPVRWWAYKAQLQRDRLHLDMQMKKKGSLNNY